MPPDRLLAASQFIITPAKRKLVKAEAEKVPPEISLSKLAAPSLLFADQIGQGIQIQRRQKMEG